MKSNASIRNTRKGLQSQMILGPKEGEVWRNHHSLLAFLASIFTQTAQMFVILCWTNEIKRYT